MTDIIYVDKDDNEIGVGPQEIAHANGIIHRVIRIYLFNSRGEVLLQKRAAHLRTNPGKWNESVAGHVDVGETYQEAAVREMQEELGLSGIELQEFKKIYLEENEENKRKRFTALYTGRYDGEVHPNAEEVSIVRWVSPEIIRKEIIENPEHFSEGSRICLSALLADVA